jgi:hypothetical protein
MSDRLDRVGVVNGQIGEGSSPRATSTFLDAGGRNRVSSTAFANPPQALTAAPWRTVCEPITSWLAQSFGRAAGFGAVLADNRKIGVVQTMSSKLSGENLRANPLTLLPAFRGPARGRVPVPLQGTLQDNPVPLACWECGKALVGKRRRFCSNECARAFPVDQVYTGEKPG